MAEPSRLRHTLPTTLLCAPVIALLCTPLTAQTQPQAATRDADGVQMLLPSAPRGSALHLGTLDPNTTPGVAFDYKARALPGATAAQEGIRYWTLPATPLTYSSGGSGFTARLHLYASGGQQRFNWKTQAGHLSSPGDVNNQEFTVYVRVHEMLTPQVAQVTLKIRGGGHSEKNPDAASSTMMTFGPASPPGITRFGKELTHPTYDYVKLQPAVDAALQDNTWVGLKLLSYTHPRHPAQVINQLHIDTTPFEANGQPANRWRLLSEYLDEEGKSTGHYSKLANWGGWQTTLRMDGYRSIDLAYPSVREVLPPAP